MASIVVIGLVLLLDVLAFVLAIGAERRRSTAYVSVDGAGRQFCVYGTDASTWYGVGALALLLVGQAVAMVASRCFCCGCSLTFLIAEVCLLAGSVRNAYHTAYVSGYYADAPLPCAMPRRGVRRRRRLRLPHHALRHAPLRLLLQRLRAPPPIINGGGIGMTCI
ncbi:hypothetical protein ZWY2020_025801 [Hordeum vulgare]|nr:hypothetical protein ZWY2020_025801 [Hordeum vulgare]